MRSLIDKAPPVVIDLSLDDYMTQKEATSLWTQIRHAYGYLMRAKYPFQLWLTGLDELNGKIIHFTKKESGYDNWLLKKTTKSYEEVFDRKDIVYLTADSETILSTLDPKTIYVIGGIVDHNRHKSLCLNIANEKKVRTAQLPISQYLKGCTRNVITVNQVFHILLKYQELKDWGEAFMAVMPARKGYKLRESEPEPADRSTGSKKTKHNRSDTCKKRKQNRSDTCTTSEADINLKTQTLTS
ncbi:hypothetical protein AAMO2058_000344800 [Amorphochlora amoebiformis]